MREESGEWTEGGDGERGEDKAENDTVERVDR